MTFKKILFIIFFLTVITSSFYRTHKTAGNNASPDIKNQLLSIWSEPFFIERNSDPPYFRIFDSAEKKKLYGYSFISDELLPDVKGYGGPLKLLITISSESKILNIELVQHHETSSFINQSRITEFLTQFIGKQSNDSISLNQDIDAITQATFTSKAITDYVRKGLDIITLKEQDTKKKTTDFETSTKVYVKDIFFLVILFISAALALIIKKTWLRWSIIISSIIYLGFIKSSMLSVIHIAQIQLGLIPQWTSNPFLIVLFCLTVISIIFYKNIYCQFICPFGGLQEISYWAGQKSGCKRFCTSEKILKISGYIKFILLFFCIFLIYLVNTADILLFEPYVILFSKIFTPINLFFVSILLIASIWIYRFWCRFFCPIGSIAELITALKLKQPPKSGASQIINFNKSDFLFVLLLMITLLCLVRITFNNFVTIKMELIKTNTISQIDSQKNIQSETLKNKWQNIGISPREAKYWEKL